MTNAMDITTPRRPGRRHCPPGRATRTGFTLTEIMIALGIMAVGLAMASAAFHAGLVSHRNSVGDYLNGLIGENAVAIARARIKHGSLKVVGTSSTIVDSIGTSDRMFPVDTVTGKGYVLLAGRATANQNDYQLTVMPYVLSKPTYSMDFQKRGEAATEIMALQTSGTVSQLAGEEYPLTFLPIGAWIMVQDAAGGLRPAQIKSGATYTRVLDRQLPAQPPPVIVIQMVLKEGTQTVSGDVNLLNPYVVRTALAPAN